MGHVERLGEMRNVYKILFGKHQGKQSRHTWKNDIKMDPTEIQCRYKHWFKLLL